METFFEKEYPRQITLLDARSAAEKIISAKATGRPLSRMPFYANSSMNSGYSIANFTDGIEEALKKKDYAKAVELLERAIMLEVNFIEEKRATYDGYIAESLHAVDKVFDLLKEPDDRSMIPGKDKVHIVPSYMFHAYANAYEGDTL
jgi:hypothetical protein